MSLPIKPRPGLRRMHQEMNSEAASSNSQLRAAVPLKRARIEEEVQTNETMQNLNGTIEELEKTRRELDKITKTMLRTKEDRDMWKRLFEDCNKKQGEEIERNKIMIVANSDFVHTSKSLFWPDVIILAAVDLDLMQTVSMAIGVQ